MKSIMISLPPETVARILNGEQTIIVRKNAPKCDLPIDGYIYCTDGRAVGKPNILHPQFGVIEPSDRIGPKRGCVCAKFTLREVERMRYSPYSGYVPKDHESSFPAEWPFWKKACITYKELWDYGNGKPSIYAWYISDLVIFEYPEELGDGTIFREANATDFSHNEPFDPLSSDNIYYRVTEEWYRPIYKAPLSWRYMEVKE